MEKLYFFTRDHQKNRAGQTGWRKQRTGIRQGCPLSPYLFLIFMTVLLHDVENEVGQKTMENCMDVVDFSNLLYADDIFLVGQFLRTE